MIYIALLVCVAITLGLLALLISVIREQQRPKPIDLKRYPSKHSSPVRQRSAVSALQQGNVSDRARLRAQAQRKRPRKKTSSTTQAFSKTVAYTPSPDRLEDARRIVKAYQATKLERLLHGDRAAAERLIQNLLDRYPDKSERWCYEKALFDLTRDRH